MVERKHEVCESEEQEKKKLEERMLQPGEKIQKERERGRKRGERKCTQLLVQQQS